jgi:hypothetical protein
VWYTIECANERHSEGPHVIMPMVFRDREAALDSAYALMKAGFSVLKVEGPDGFQMRETALAAYQQSRRNKRSSG